MSLNDPLADALSKMNNAVKALNGSVTLRRSKFLLKLLDVLKENGYIGSYEVIEKNDGDIVKVNLIGTINKCGIIKPRFPVKMDELESFEKRFLPAKDFGVLLISTNQGLLTQKQAKEKHTGGTLIAYCY